MPSPLRTYCVTLRDTPCSGKLYRGHRSYGCCYSSSGRAASVQSGLDCPHPPVSDVFGLTLTAVAAIKVDCENDYLTRDGTTTPLTADDNHTFLVAGTLYWLVIGNVRVALPTWTPPMLSEFGLLPTQCR
jgi:hypothetical protein